MPRTPTSIDGINERVERGLIILSPAQGPVLRRVFFVNSYGGRDVWTKIKQGEMPGHHLWGCLELARMGYEVALAEAVPHFNYRKHVFPHDLRLLSMVQSWLRRDDIVYCGHNVLFWIPFLRTLRLFRRHLVSLLYANETLDFSGAHSGVIALTPTAAARAAIIAPNAKIAHLGWGADLASYPVQPYSPKYFFHCGIAGRDFPVLNAASQQSPQPVRIVASEPIPGLSWPAHVEIIYSGRGYNHENKKVHFGDLVSVHYAGASASLIITIPNPLKNHALGFTNLVEALALGKPIIHTRTGALADEIDVEKAGCGLSVPAGDPNALARAMDTIMNDPARSASMARESRTLAEKHYNIGRYAAQLHRFFQSL